MKSRLFGIWLELVETDWDMRLEEQGNPYTFASMKKCNKKAYVERLHELSLSYWRRNRFKLWEEFYNAYLKPTKHNYAEIVLKNTIQYGSSYVRFKELADYKHTKPLVLYPTKKRSMHEILSSICSKIVHLFIK